MKKIILLSMILPALSFGQYALTNDVVLSGQSIIVQPDFLLLDSVEYHAASVVTNVTREWSEPVETVTALGPTSGGGFVTNMAPKQITVTTVTTNAERWVCNVRFEVPKDHVFPINGFPMRLKSLKTYSYPFPIPADWVRAYLGDAYVGVARSASGESAYLPGGADRDAYLYFAAAVFMTGN